MQTIYRRITRNVLVSNNPFLRRNYCTSKGLPEKTNFRKKCDNTLDKAEKIYASFGSNFTKDKILNYYLISTAMTTTGGAILGFHSFAKQSAINKDYIIGNGLLGAMYGSICGFFYPIVVPSCIISWLYEKKYSNKKITEI